MSRPRSFDFDTVEAGLMNAFDAKPVAERIVRGRNRISVGSVTAGINYGLAVAADLAGEDVAKAIQLALEYDPQPPFDTGRPEKAGRELAAKVRAEFSSVPSAS